VHLACREVPGEEGGEDALLCRAEAMNRDGGRGPSHHLMVLLPSGRSCKTNRRL
jgi:hypothetical protein